MQPIQEILGPEGALARHLPGFTYREAQASMAELVLEAFATGGHAAIEAGTGIGKTFAYLIPVLLSGRRSIVSTGTKTLQDQLFARDLPLLGNAIGAPVTVALLKGRSNYLCHHRLAMARTDPQNSRQAQDLLDALEQWSGSSPDGDLGALEDLESDPVLRARVTSTIDNCLGSQCEAFDRCFVVEARRKAQAAKVVVVNHHLLLADLALKETGFGDLLGDAETVVVDEAHMLADIAQQFFGLSVSSREIARLTGDVEDEIRLAGVVEPDGPVTSALQRAQADLLHGAGRLSGRLPWHGLPRMLLKAANACRDELATLSQWLREAEDASSGLQRCRERCESLRIRLDAILDDDSDNGLRWAELRGRGIGFSWTPLDIGQALSERIRMQGGQWIMTSATLAVADRFEHFLGRIGLSVEVSGVLASPFDYARNARLYLPQGLPLPRDDDYVESLMRHVWPLVQASDGGAFLLFTSHRALERAERFVRARGWSGPVLVQGSGPRSELLERFRESRRSVLLGTNSFWQGVDVRGDTLRLVVIDKLPFAAPGDPLIEARMRAIEQAGGDAFNDFQLPQAVIALKQGVGRLIRDDDDRGLIVLCDPRLRTKGYGRVFLDSLPPATRINEYDDALEFANNLRPRIPSSAAGMS